jgi:hypothetical protein
MAAIMMEGTMMEGTMWGPTISDFKRAILEQHGVRSDIIAGERVAVDGWAGQVLVFALFDHPWATLCYAWRTDRGIMVALHGSPIDSPEVAVLSAPSTPHP